jgi:hypothetical protein
MQLDETCAVVCNAHLKTCINLHNWTNSYLYFALGFNIRKLIVQFSLRVRIVSRGDEDVATKMQQSCGDINPIQES